MLLKRVLGMAALLPVLLYGASDGWDNINPDRPEAPAGKVFWSESFEKELTAKSLNIEFRDGATGEVKVVPGIARSGGKALLVKKTNSLGYIKISPQNPCIVPAKQQLQSAVYVHCRNANPGFMPAFIRMYGKKESLAYFKALDGRGSAGPKMDYLVNTPPGSWERKICRLQVNNSTGTAITPAIIVAGPPSESIWDDWKIEDLKGALKNWQKYIKSLDAVKQPDEMVSEAEFDAALAKDIDHTAKIMTRDGIARLYIDGREEIPVLFKDSTKKLTDKIVSGAPIQNAGVKIRAITLRLGNSPKQYGPWTKDGFDVAAAVKFIRDRMRGSNESVFLISLLCHVYPEFTQEHPEEIWIDPKGRKVYGHNVHAHYWLDQPMDPNRHWYWVSMHSLVWREAVKKQIGILIDELKRTGLSKRIVGVHIGGFHDQQFATRHMDISKPAVEGFRRYLKRKYVTVDALEKAWGRKGLNFDTVTAPQFGKKEFFVPGQDQDKIDFYDFQKTGPFEAQEDIAAFAKKRLGKDVIAVRWCMEAFGGTLGSALDITAFVNSKVIDILCAQPNYPTRSPGLPNEVRLPLASFHLNNKIFIDEFDLRTYGKISNSETEMRVLGLSQALDHPMWQSIHHKLAGKMIAGEMGYWYFDMAGGWFNPPEILHDISQVNKIRRLLNTRSAEPWTPPMVLVVDEEGLKLRNIPHSHYCFDQIRLTGKQNEMLSASAVPYELRLLDDFLKNPELGKQYKVVIFSGMYHIDAKRKALIESLQQDGRTLVYLAGTGALGGGEVTGFEWKNLSRGKITHEIVPADGVTMNMLSAIYNEQLTKMMGMKLGGDYHCPTRYSVAENDGVKVWSRFKADKQPAVATKKLHNSLAVAVGSPAALTPEFVNYLAVKSGAYVPSKPGLQINMNRKFMSVHALIPGKYQIELPFACQLRNLKSGKIEKCNGKTFILDAEAGSSYWFALEKHGENIDPDIYKERKPVMKKQLVTLGAALTLSAGAANLFPAGNFDGGAAGWRSFDRNFKNFYKVENGAMTIVGNDSYTERIAAYYPLNIKLEAGKKYVIRADVKSNVASPAEKRVEVVIRYVNSNGRTISYRGVNIVLGNPEFREFSNACVTPAGTEKVQLYVQAKGLTSADSVTIDNIKILPFEELQAAPGNLVKNGDFEYALLEPWYTSRGRVKNQYCYVVNDGDNRVLTLTGDKKYTSVSLIQKIQRLDINKKYTVTARVKVVNVKPDPKKRFQIRVRSAGEKNKSLTYAERSVKPVNGDWQEVKFTFTPHPKSVANQVYLCVVGFEAGDAVLFDDVVLTQAE